MIQSLCGMIHALDLYWDLEPIYQDFEGIETLISEDDELP